LRIGMRTENRPEKIVRRRDIRYPVPHRFVDRIFQRAAAGLHSAPCGAKKPHPNHIQALPLHVFRAHIHGACETEPRRNGRRCNAMLPGASFRHHAALPHPHREQALSYAVVNLVRARVEQIFALQVNPRPAKMLAQPRSKLKWRWAPSEISKERIELRLKFRIFSSFGVRLLELFERSDQRFWNIAAPIRSETPVCIRHRLWSRTHFCLVSAAFTAHINATIRAGSFLPGRASMPLHTSTAYGRATRIASATFSGVKPPARKMRRDPFEPR